MSLINDALKKAQRQRAPDAAGAPGASTPTGSVAKRSPPLAAKWIVLLALGAVALVVVAAVSVTLFVLSDTPAPPPAKGSGSREAFVSAPSPTVALPPSSAVRDPSSENSVVSPPPSAVGASRAPSVLSPPPSVLSPPSSAVRSPSSVVSPPPSAVGASRASSAVNPPSSAIGAPSAPAVSFAIPHPDERIIAYVDRIRVAGIRSSGADSKVLMNDRVYRVGDIVDRELGLKLIKVAPDVLTFEDAKGLTYPKNF